MNASRRVWDSLRDYFAPSYPLPPLFGASEAECAKNTVKPAADASAAAGDSGALDMEDMLLYMKKLRVSRTLRLASLLGSAYLSQQKAESGRVDPTDSDPQHDHTRKHE
eukprot:ANDGO_01204.mRNA.1 hypothetical protein